MIVAQVSDFHAHASERLPETGVPANRMAAAAVAHLNRLDPRPDLVVISGDLADTGDEAEYAAVRAILAPLAIPFVVLPGNHDKREPLRRAFADHAYLPAEGPLHYVVDCGPLRIVALDTTVPDLHHGKLDAAGLDWLATTLRAEPARPTLVFLHHHPFASRIPYLDDYALREPERLAAIVAKHPQVLGLFCGHVHRSITAGFAGTLAISCPSTSTQIALRLAPDATPASYMEPPGGLLHVWTEGVGLVSHLFPIGDFGPAMDFF